MLADHFRDTIASLSRIACRKADRVDAAAFPFGPRTRPTTELCTDSPEIRVLYSSKKFTTKLSQSTLELLAGLRAGDDDIPTARIGMFVTAGLQGAKSSGVPERDQNNCR